MAPVASEIDAAAPFSFDQTLAAAAGIQNVIPLTMSDAQLVELVEFAGRVDAGINDTAFPQETMSKNAEQHSQPGNKVGVEAEPVQLQWQQIWKLLQPAASASQTSPDFIIEPATEPSTELSSTANVPFAWLEPESLATPQAAGWIRELTPLASFANWNPPVIQESNAQDAQAAPGAAHESENQPQLQEAPQSKGKTVDTPRQNWQEIGTHTSAQSTESVQVPSSLVRPLTLAIHRDGFKMWRNASAAPGNHHEPASENAPTPVPRQQAAPVMQNVRANAGPFPSVARALQVEASVMLENASGQSSYEGGTVRAPAVIMNPGEATHFKSATLAQQLPDVGRQLHDASGPGQIMRGLVAMVNQRGGVMNMRLDPPELGQLRVQMTIMRGNVIAEFHAATQQAHSLLEQNLGALRSALENQGLTVDRLTVHHAPPQSSAQQNSRDDSMANSQGQQQQENSRQDAAGSESRGRQEHAHRDWDLGSSDVEFADLFAELGSAEFAPQSQPVRV